MALERYRQKRDFRVTPEPPGRLGRRRARTLRFVVQKHAARRLHYDFRLELNGVLLSWAVPKGPSLDPNDKRLAVHVEDHPLEYGEFEGVIPPKEYGAGTVMIWDRGTWMPKSDPEDGYAKGHLKFELHGEKLKGGWNLVRTGSRQYGGERSWLLIKEADDFARLGPEAHVAEDRAESAASGRSIEEIAHEADRVWHSNQPVAANVKGGAIAKRKTPAKTRLAAQLAKLEGARKSALPRLVEAQLATLVKSPASGEGWAHEIKFDGYRMLARIGEGQTRMFSRSGKDWTSEFASVARTLTHLPVASAWLDGEVVVLDARGRSHFQSLQNALSDASGAALTYFAFDLLYLDGYDLRGVALGERKRLLRKLLAGAPATLRYSEHFAAPGSEFLRHVCALGLEGMVSKRLDLPHQAGRGPTWQKVKCGRRQEFVVGGFTDPQGSRTGFGALLLGVYEPDGRLSYCGKVGTGFDDRLLASLGRRLQGLVQKEPSFHNPPHGAEGRRVHWVKPVLVAEAAFAEWTANGTLRQPSFEGLREDKPAREVVREREIVAGGNPRITDDPPGVTPRVAPRGSAAKDTVAGIALSNPDKLLYPEARLAKRDLALYYAAVGEQMLPHLRDRPLTLLRCPNGWDRKCFYQKNADGSVHEAISRVRVGDGSLYMMANSVTAIVALLQMGVLEIHPWGSRSERLGFPDRIVFDLDPDESLTWAEVRQAVLLVKALLENIGLPAFLKTTGGKGLHVVAPIEPALDWNRIKGFTKAVAELLERTFPDRFTANPLKTSRGGRVFVDYLRNAEGATAVAAYSLRARANAPVSTPLGWDELDEDVRFARFHARNVPQRLARMRRDPWAALEECTRPLTAATMARVGYKAR